MRNNRTNISESISQMKALLRKNKNISLKEAFNISEDDYDFDDNMDDYAPNQPQGNPSTTMPMADEAGDVDSILKQIRLLALKGITMLAETPQDPNYENLKKIWTFVDKATSEKKDAENAE